MKKAMILIVLFLASNAHAFEFCKNDPEALNELLKDKALRDMLLTDAVWKTRYGGLIDGVQAKKVPEGVAITFNGDDIRGKEVCVNLIAKRIYTKTGRTTIDALTLLPKPRAAVDASQVATNVAR